MLRHMQNATITPGAALQSTARGLCREQANKSCRLNSKRGLLEGEWKRGREGGVEEAVREFFSL